MVAYLARQRYRGVINGRTITVRPGDVLDLDVADVDPITRDCPGLVDWSAPLTPDQAAQARAEAERRTAEREAARRAAIRDHVQRHGGTCPDHGPVWELDAVEDGGGWRIVCALCRVGL